MMPYLYRFKNTAPWSTGAAKPPFSPVADNSQVLYSYEFNSAPFFPYTASGPNVCLTSSPIDITPFFSTFRNGNDAISQITFRLMVLANEPLASFAAIVSTTGNGGGSAGISFPAGFSVNPMGYEIFEGSLGLGGSVGTYQQFVQGWASAKNSGINQVWSSTFLALYTGTISLNLCVVPGTAAGTAIAQNIVIESKVVG
jgi:hypothetical protein